MRKTLISFSNLLARRRRNRVPPERLLLLVSSCLQRSACDCKLTESLDRCRACGQCIICRLRELAAEKGIRVFMATGGRLAAQKARDKSVEAIVAVACCKELAAGIRATFPKPVLSLALGTPHGPCKDTTVDFEAVRQAVEFFLP